jgi:phenylacetate-CoA ligase
VGKQVLFSAYHLKPRFLPYYIEELNRRRPPWIQGYPSILAVIAGYMLEHDAKLDYIPTVVMSSSESLLPHQRTIIEEAFGTRCRQLYSMTEAVASITECPEGRLHIDEDFSCVELIAVDSSCFRLVGTSYANHAFPLIRYDTGDIVEMGTELSCPCGRAGRVIASIDGRREDYVVTPDGRKIGRLDHILKDMTFVRECQICQTSTAAVTFRVVRALGYNADHEARLVCEAKRRLGQELAIHVEYRDVLPRTARGKLRFVISTVGQRGRLL